jgi:beta-galactosidase GanA
MQHESHQVSRRTVLGLAGAAVSVVVLGARTDAFADTAAGAATVVSTTGKKLTPHAVTWDEHSVIVDGKPVYLWSGELHPFRVPSPSLWRDMLQKMHSNGYNTVSIYVDWGYESPKQGVYDWTGVRDLDQFLDIAQEVGIYVIARPGPYINAEVDGGGFPGWLKTTPGRARTDDPTYLKYADEYLTEVYAILARHQLTDGGGTVVLVQIENEYAAYINSGPDTSTIGSRYMAHLYEKVRADGVTVPVFHNDKGRNGYWRPGDFPIAAIEKPPNYLYGFDGYPAGTPSSSGNPGTPGVPPDWGSFGVGGRTGGATASPTTPGLLAEFGGGWFDPWGDQLWGGAGYPAMRARQNSAMERQYYLTNVANGIRIHNVYMTYGGTSWGWLAAPIVYSSYDYGAAFDEARQLTSKVPTMKELGYFLRSVPSINKAVRSDGAPASDATVRTYHLANTDDGTQFSFVRNDNKDTTPSFTLPLTTPDGNFTVPQSGSLQLQGVDMKTLVSNYNMDSQHLVYSTSELMTHTGYLDGNDLALFYTRDGQDGESVLRYANSASQPSVKTVSGDAPTVTWDASTRDLRLNYHGNGLSVVRVSGVGVPRALTLLLASESIAQTFWRLDTPKGPVIVRGPEMLRTAEIYGAVVNLTGDTKDAAPLEVWGPTDTREVIWNQSRVVTTRTAVGSLLARGDLAAAPAVLLPLLTGWKFSVEAPESQPGFDDTTWQTVDKATSNSTTTVPTGQPVLFADDYGFHHGDVWYRGRYAGDPAASAVLLTYQTGQVGLLEAWLDGRYLGFDQIPTPTSKQSTQQTWTATASFDIPPELRSGDEHQLAVLVRPMGSEEDGGANDAFKSARGLLSASFTTATIPITWKVQGNQGGEDIADTVRGPMNNGGLYGERAGWSLPGYPDRGWDNMTLPSSSAQPGVGWYRTTFDLDVSKEVDVSLGLTIADDPAKTYRALIFVNGWNLGQYINDVGPQHTFVLPNGILDPNGTNTLAIAVIANTASGGLGSVSLTNLGTVRGGAPLTLVRSPSYVAPKLAPAAVTARVGQEFSGEVAAVTVPADAAGTALSATIDWGDGNRSQVHVTGTGLTRQVLAGHTWEKVGYKQVTVLLSDTYGPTLARSRSRARVS